MPGPVFDAHRFFEAFPRFLDTSETGPARERLNARYLALIHANRELLAGARVLDLASHDGRFTFAALLNGAAHVTGIEHDPALVQTAYENLTGEDVPRDRYAFVLGNLLDQMDLVDGCDVVFCFGILYHLTDHMQLLSRIAELEPRHLLIDTNVSLRDGAVVEIRNAFGASPPPPGSYLEGYPTRAALESMLSYFGWTHEFYDWAASGLITSKEMSDYRTGRRVTVVADCHGQTVSREVRDQAVDAVLRERHRRHDQRTTIGAVAARFAMRPEALRFWVRQAERRPEQPAPPPPPRPG